VLEYQSQVQRVVKRSKRIYQHFWERYLVWDLYKGYLLQDPVNKFRKKLVITLFLTRDFMPSCFLRKSTLMFRRISGSWGHHSSELTVRGVLRVPWKARVFFNGTLLTNSIKMVWYMNTLIRGIVNRARFWSSLKGRGHLKRVLSIWNTQLPHTWGSTAPKSGKWYFRAITICPIVTTYIFGYRCKSTSPDSISVVMAEGSILQLRLDWQPRKSLL